MRMRETAYWAASHLILLCRILVTVIALIIGIKERRRIISKCIIEIKGLEMGKMEMMENIRNKGNLNSI